MRDLTSVTRCIYKGFSSIRLKQEEGQLARTLIMMY